MSAQKLANLNELREGEMKSFHVGKTRVLLVRFGGGVFAYEDACAHQGVPLSEGKLEGTVVTCRAHQWCFDLALGRGIGTLAAKLRSLPIEIRNGEVWIEGDL